jgi:hypothetical protein
MLKDRDGDFSSNAERRGVRIAQGLIAIRREKTCFTVG